MAIRRALPSLTPEQASVIETIAERKSYTFGETIVKQNQRPDRLFIMVMGEGRLTLHRGATLDAEFTGPLGPGELFGELSFVDGKPASASITADGDAEVIEIPGPALRELLDSDPSMAANVYKDLMRAVASRLRKANLRIITQADLE